MTTIIIEAINAIPDDVRMVIFPLIRMIVAFLGLTLWEDGSVG